MPSVTETKPCDLPCPIKRSLHMGYYREAEERLERVIWQTFGLALEMPPSVKRADNALLRTEQRDLMKPAPAEWQDNREGALEHRITPWPPFQARYEFLRRYEQLNGHGF